MEAKVKRNGEVFVVHMSGKIVSEAVEVFNRGVKYQLMNEKFILELSNLSFVGSNGITTLLETLKEFARIQGRPLRMYGVPSEFVKIFAANLRDSFLAYENEELAIRSFYEDITPVAPVAIEETIEEVLRADEGTVTPDVVGNVLFTQSSTPNLDRAVEVVENTSVIEANVSQAGANSTSVPMDQNRTKMTNTEGEVL